MRFSSCLCKKKNTLRTHNSSCIIQKELQIKFLDIYWVVSNFFCLSHFKSLFSLHSDLIVEIKKKVYLFQNFLSLLCWILRFRHYFGDPYLFPKRQQHTLLFFSFYRKIRRTRLPLWYTFDRKIFITPASNKFYFFLFQTSSNFHFSIHICKIDLQSSSNLLIGTNLRFFLRIKNHKDFLLELHHVLLTTQDKLGSSEIEQIMSSQEHFHSYGKWWM